MLALPPSATIWPTLSAWLSGALRFTVTLGVPVSSSVALLPAARMTSPPGLAMTPSLVTVLPMR